jgi:hypothetical protein
VAAVGRRQRLPVRVAVRVVSWFAVDDRFHHHRKVALLRRSEHCGTAIALWTLAGSWAAGDDTARLTGTVPLYVIEEWRLSAMDEALSLLVDVALWSCDGESVTFHDWSMWNGPGAKSQRYEARLAADRVRQERARKRPKKSAEGVSRDSHASEGTGRDGPGTGRAATGWDEVPAHLTTPSNIVDLPRSS